MACACNSSNGEKESGSSWGLTVKTSCYNMWAPGQWETLSKTEVGWHGGNDIWACSLASKHMYTCVHALAYKHRTYTKNAYIASRKKWIPRKILLHFESVFCIAWKKGKHRNKCQGNRPRRHMQSVQEWINDKVTGLKYCLWQLV